MSLRIFPGVCFLSHVILNFLGVSIKFEKFRIFTSPASNFCFQMMGSQGLRKASQVAILNANYMSKRLGGHFKTLYTNENGEIFKPM